MKRWKSSEPCDRLSELPDMVIFHILSFLSMRDVVTTTLLSKRWKDLWTMIPCLTFQGTAASPQRFHSFVNGVLIFWRGTSILKFKVDLVFNLSFTRNLDTWLCFAKKNRVEELHVELSGPDNYIAPRCLYSCSSMRNLFLRGFDLTVNGKIHWNHLKSLRIERVILSEHVMNQLLSGSPRLEVLFLSFRYSYENLNVQSSSLKVLKIENIIYHGSDKRTMLRIWAPNLETFEILGLPYFRSQLIDISSICSASVFVHAPAISSAHHLFEEILRQLSQSKRPVGKVFLCRQAFKVLAQMKKKAKDMLAPLSNAKFLKIFGGVVDEWMDLLDIFPNLTMLVFDHKPVVAHQDLYHHFKISCLDKGPFVPRFDAEDSLDPKTDIPMPYLPHLRTVEVTYAMLDGSIFLLIDFLLKCDKLEKVVFKVERIGSSPKPLDPFLCVVEYLMSVTQKLLSMQRSFPAAEVILCSDDSITS